MRIVAGRWSGRRIDPAPGSRPTAERVREALFSIWSERITGARFLDLFCGGGGAGLEALSRGAGSATLVDSERRALRAAARNRELLDATAAVTVAATLPRGLGRPPLCDRVFDLVFADPPYDFDQWQDLLERLEPLLAPAGEIVIEHATRVALPERAGGIEALQTRRYGDTTLTFFQARAGRG